jgi:hypothetical protein
MRPAIFTFLRYTIPAIVAAIAGGIVTVRQSEIAAKEDFAKAKLGVEALAQESNKLAAHSAEQERDIATLKGHVETVERLMMVLVAARPAISRVGAGGGMAGLETVRPRLPLIPMSPPSSVGANLKALVEDPGLRARPQMQQMRVPIKLDEIIVQGQKSK